MYKDTHRNPRAPRYRSAEELSFAFSVLLAQPISRAEAAVLFEALWNEANDAATACLTDASAFGYIALLKEMDKRWRHASTLH
ncbi:MAG: hypothetical protein WDN30_13045 [Pararobbsia sp.]